jgi:hypothetical protein
MFAPCENNLLMREKGSRFSERLRSSLDFQFLEPGALQIFGNKLVLRIMNLHP